MSWGSSVFEGGIREAVDSACRREIGVDISQLVRCRGRVRHRAGGRIGSIRERIKKRKIQEHGVMRKRSARLIT